MQCRDEGSFEPAEQRQMNPVYMTMDHVELVRSLGHAFEERRERHHRIDDGPAQPQRLRTNSDQFRARLRAAAGEQRDFVA